MKLETPYKHITTLDVSKIQKILPPISDSLWHKNVIRQKLYKVHNQTLSILFKWNSNSNETTDKSFIDYNLIQSELGKLSEDLIKSVLPFYPQKQISKAMLALMPPNTQIGEHIDSNILKKVHRIHIPIITHPKCIFNIDGNDYYFREGYCFEFDNTRPHFVQNNSNISRIHLMLDLI